MKNKNILTFFLFALTISMAFGQAKPRIIVETDIGGDADDQATFVRFLLYSNEFDIEGIITNRAVLTNTVRNSFNVPQRRFPAAGTLLGITKKGLDRSGNQLREGPDLIIEALKDPDPRPIWYTDWGTNFPGAKSALRQALNRIRSGGEGISYPEAVRKIRFVEFENLGGSSIIGTHLNSIPFIMDTYTPGSRRSTRWMDRWPYIAGEDCPEGFNTDESCNLETWRYLNDISRTLPFARLYTIQKEGDTMTWMHLLSNGINVIGSPELGGWAGRYAQKNGERFWKTQNNGQSSDRLLVDGRNRETTNRDNTLIRWSDRRDRNRNKATDIINDFKVRWQWALTNDRGRANHHPIPNINGDVGLKPLVLEVGSGDVISLDASRSTDPDNDSLNFQWEIYHEISTIGASLTVKDGPRTAVTIPNGEGTVHAYVRITDNDGAIPLTRYKRVIFNISPCPNTLNITQNVTSGSSNRQARSILTASNIISSGATATYTAGERVVLQSGFVARQGSWFTSFNKACAPVARKAAVAQQASNESWREDLNNEF